MHTTEEITSACELRALTIEEIVLEVAATATRQGRPLDGHYVAALRTLAPYARAAVDALDWAVSDADPVCADADPEAWFLLADDPYASPGERARVAAREDAAELCETCPARAQCLALSYALGASGRWGIWGGLSARDRAVLRPWWLELRSRLAEQAAAEREGHGEHADQHGQAVA